MLTKHQLAELLREVNVVAVAREAGVATKTIYRLRHPDKEQAPSPTLRTVEAVVAAVNRLRSKEAA